MTSGLRFKKQKMHWKCLSRAEERMMDALESNVWHDYVRDGRVLPSGTSETKAPDARRFASLRLLVALEGMLHLHAGRRIAALAVEAALCSIAVEKALGAPDIPGHRVEGIDHLEAEALGLVGLGDADFLDVAYACAVPDAARVRGVRDTLGIIA